VRLNNSPHIQPGQLLPSDRLILGYLQRLARAYGPESIWPSVATIAQRCGLSERTIPRAVKRLEYAGLIQVEPAPNKTGRRFVLSLLNSLLAAKDDRPRIEPAQAQVEPEQVVKQVEIAAQAQVDPAPCHPKRGDATVSPNDSSVSLQNQKKSSERQPKAPARPPRVTTSSLPEQDRAVLAWFVDRRQRAGRIGNRGAYEFALAIQWANSGVPVDIAQAYAAWERARASRIAQERLREQERIERLASGPEPPQPELGAMIRAMLPARYRAPANSN